jgi:hypothetical protein
MGAAGTAIVDFGAFPGQSDASVTVLSPGISVSSLVEAWILPETTVDHSPDEHVVETLSVKADQSAIIANTSFVIRVTNTSQLADLSAMNTAQGVDKNGMGGRIYGRWCVGWVWD